MRRLDFTRNDFIKLFGAVSISMAFPPLRDALGTRGAKSSPPPNILVLVFDALSARDMSIYGYPRPTTPNLERFAQRATVYHRHWTAGNFTTPGTASLLTGLMPWTHRALHLQGETLAAYADQNIFSLLPTAYHRFAYTHNSLAYILLDQFHRHIDDLLKISALAAYSDIFTDQVPFGEFHTPLEAELLAFKGSYQSSLFLSLLDQTWSNARVERLLRLEQKEYPRGLTNCRSGEAFNAVCFKLEQASDWIIRQVQARPQPFFGYVHLFPPHSPYNPRREFVGLFDVKLDTPIKPAHHFSEGKDGKSLQRQRRKYDETVAYVDAEFGRILDALEKSNSLENTLVLVTSDHGEINERGISGHNTPVLYEPLTHIPLLIAYPGQTQRQDIRQPTHAIDVAPTLLQSAGADLPAWIEGMVLPREARSTSADKDLFVVEAKSSPKLGKMHTSTFALLHGRHKLIYYHGYDDYAEKFEVYDLEEDPEELQDLAPTHTSLLKDLQAILFQKIDGYI